MGNFFSMMVMGLFAVFWLSFGLLQLPTLALASAYSATGDAAEGAASVGYNATIALYLIVWGFALFTFFIFTLKTNIVFAAIFFFVTIAAWVLSGAYWKVASGDYVTAGQLQKVRAFRTYYAKADNLAGRRRIAFHCWIVGMVYDFCHDGGGNALGHQASGGRSQPFLAKDRCRDGHGSEGEVEP